MTYHSHKGLYSCKMQKNISEVWTLSSKFLLQYLFGNSFSVRICQNTLHLRIILPIIMKLDAVPNVSDAM